MRTTSAIALALALPLVASGCAEADPSTSSSQAMAAEAPAADAGQELPTVLVYKAPTCGCCNGWIEHLEAAGFTVDARDTRDLMVVKRDAGVPTQLSSCHTAIVDGYVVEGHIPAEHVKSLLADRPDVAGIAVPGMPIGSPGMEGPNPQPYQVYSFTRDGQAAVYAEVDPR
ncbi:MAG: DUF411 domain-containing protein [Gemmatimonadetes bacterium]|nr:DUF411 domain-containing protein [Gemmatimonadota bacterium]NNL29437.1 DUF411 domain-containing protein [Gemmatimonadota bacterium]